MKVTNELVQRIIQRAEKSQFGLESSERALDIDMYEPPNLQSLALMLTSGWHAKYDLVSVFSAAFQVIEEEAKKDV
jgi:hypothetical protein